MILATKPLKQSQKDEDYDDRKLSTNKGGRKDDISLPRPPLHRLNSDARRYPRNYANEESGGQQQQQLLEMYPCSRFKMPVTELLPSQHVMVMLGYRTRCWRYGPVPFPACCC
ncbi:hypothetical protein JTE90_022286 [Oedothorax gibbosus]|uniref:Uncharacterized protein n=1 Tax=Oedothorax gibbosus TaxID=931172 RepID=A0AAV6VWT3_9ARAC|nr:hypothetical protein JTE90_022286 [Oedothorax gibbosus]